MDRPCKKITIEGFKLKLAATADEKVIVIFDDSPTINAIKTGAILLTKDYGTASSRTGNEAVLRKLKQHNIELQRVIVIESTGTVFGYIIETSKPAYSILTKHLKPAQKLAILKAQTETTVWPFF